MRPVYPRWRREHAVIRYFQFITPGLSPLARGTHTEEVKELKAQRFIPAGAGNTAPTNALHHGVSVYPRWRREHSYCSHTESAAAGLSPLAQGTPEEVPRLTSVDRFIPAGAGNTRVGKSRGNRTPVYPRWRREHAELEPALRRLPGLSPLAQGTRRFCRGRCHVHRFIPAGAGNTARQYEMPLWSPVYPRWRREHTKHTYLFLNNFIPQQQSTN